MSTPTVSSTSPADASTSTSTPSATQTSNSGGGPSSSLYLFTFLATLFLLLFVSSAIILRSFVLRRRFRRRVEEALAGIVAPTHTGRVRSRRAIGEKPKLWEARVAPASDDKWDTIIPVSAQPTSTFDKRTKLSLNVAADVDPGGGSETRATAPVTAVAPPQQLTQNPPPPPIHRRQWLRNPFSRRQEASSPSVLPLAPISQPTRLEDSPGDPQRQNALPPSTHHDPLQVTVLIAMPDPRRPHPDGNAFSGHTKGKAVRSLDLDYDEDDLPDMVLGMAELHYNDAITTPRTP